MPAADTKSEWAYLLFIIDQSAISETQKLIVADAVSIRKPQGCYRQ